MPAQSLGTALLAAAALAGCAGSSDDAGKMEALEATCDRQLGATYESAEVALLGGYPVGPRCIANLSPLPANDECGPAAEQVEVCEVIYYWFSADPTVCQGGSCTCELRILKSAFDAQQGTAMVCAALFQHGPAL